MPPRGSVTIGAVRASPWRTAAEGRARGRGRHQEGRAQEEGWERGDGCAGWGIIGREGLGRVVGRERGATVGRGHRRDGGARERVGA